MTLARTRLVVIAFGLVVLLAVVAGLAVVGGPGTGRSDRRDAARIEALREIADALDCHVRAAAVPAQPSAPAEISPACLSPDAGRRLVDPRTGAPYRIAYPAPGQATVCADFEGRVADGPAGGRRPFDAASGCISASLPGG